MMKQAVKSRKKIVKAYQLGSGSGMEQQLIREGAILVLENGDYELFSLEAVNGKGELAKAGDYFKVDEIEGRHYPYPNGREWFEENHVCIGEEEYEQVNKPRYIWQAGEPKSEEVEYLLQNGKLTIREEDDAHYFNAFLWGANLSAARDAILIFYQIARDRQGRITEIGFNFIAREIFEANYEICGTDHSSFEAEEFQN